MSTTRVEITAPDGYTVVDLERRLAALGQTRVGEARGWVLELDGDLELAQVEGVVSAWLRDSKLPSTHMVVGGRHVHVDAAATESHSFEVHPDSAAI